MRVALGRAAQDCMKQPYTRPSCDRQRPFDRKDSIAGDSLGKYEESLPQPDMAGVSSAQ